MIPTTTGAPKRFHCVAGINGKLTHAIRVPTPNVSVIDFVAMLKRKTDVVKSTLLSRRPQGSSGILGFSEEPLVSIDFNGNPFRPLLMPPALRLLVTIWLR